MKKNAFLALILLLSAVVSQAQNLANISGLVMNLSNGLPVANHPIFCIAGDSINPVFGNTVTNPDGTYSISLDLPAGISEVAVSTFTSCDPTGGFVTSNITVVNGAASADFLICSDSFPPFSNCFADIWIVPLGGLTIQFTGNYYSLTDSLAVGTSYLWDFGDGTTSTDSNPTHTYAAQGFYTISLTITGEDGCTATASFSFSTDFNGFPDCMGYILYTQNSTTSFDFSAELFDANGMPIQATSYNWDFGDGNSSTDPAPSHTYASTGVYTVQLHAITADSCEIHACDVVFAHDCPIDTFWYGCQAMFYVGYGDSLNNPVWPPQDPNTVTFYDASLGGVVSWHWDFGDGTTSTDPNPTHTYLDSLGIYLVTLTILTVDGCESEASYEICVGASCWSAQEFDCQAMFIPLVDSLGGNGIQFVDLSFSLDPIVAWNWNFGDGSTSNEQNPFHEYAQPGVYTVTLIIEGLLCNSSISFEIDTESPWNFNNSDNPAQLGVAAGSVSTQTPFAFEGIKMFPNPAQTDLSIAFSSHKALDYELRISDLTGKVVSQSNQQAISGINAARINVSNLVPGLYLAEIRTGNSVQALKFVKQ